MALPSELRARALALLIETAPDAKTQGVAALAAAWSADHWRHAWAGHDLPHDDPVWTVERIGAWLAQPAADPEIENAQSDLTDE